MYSYWAGARSLFVNKSPINCDTQIGTGNMYFKLKRHIQQEKEYRSSLLNDRPLAESHCFSLDTTPLKGQASLICLLFEHIT
jgi:hypothetical protein